MLAWRSANPRLSWHHFGFLLLGLLLGANCTASESFNIHSASTQLIDGTYRLDAQIEYSLNEDVRKAVKSGVPVIVSQEIEILRLRRWLWPQVIKRISLRYQLQYHALSKQFILIYLHQGKQRTYPNLAAAIKRLGTIRDYPLIAQEELDPERDYQVRLRTRLSIEDLPVPLQPLAYFSSQWHLDSPWFTWSLGSPGA